MLSCDLLVQIFLLTGIGVQCDLATALKLPACSEEQLQHVICGTLYLEVDTDAMKSRLRLHIEVVVRWKPKVLQANDDEKKDEEKESNIFNNGLLRSTICSLFTVW